MLERLHQRGDIFLYDAQQRVPFDFVGKVPPHDVYRFRRDFGKRAADGVVHVVDDYIVAAAFRIRDLIRRHSLRSEYRRNGKTQIGGEIYTYTTMVLRIYSLGGQLSSPAVAIM